MKKKINTEKKSSISLSTWTNGSGKSQNNSNRHEKNNKKSVQREKQTQ